AGAPAPMAGARGGSSMSRLAIALGALGLVAALLAGRALLARRDPTIVAQLPMPRGLVLQEFWRGSAIAPDGQSVIASGQVRNEAQCFWLWRLDAAAPVEVAGT